MIGANSLDIGFSFAKTGDPNGPGLPHWPRYGGKTDAIMDFSPDGPKGGADPFKARFDVTAEAADAALKK